LVTSDDVDAQRAREAAELRDRRQEGAIVHAWELDRDQNGTRRLGRFVEDGHRRGGV
jgi:hypothetical protein